MPKIILGLVGKIGCGKGTVADLLRNEYGAGYFRFSSILSDILTRLAIEKSRDNLIQLSVALRAQFGEDVLSYAIESEAINAAQDLVIIDGIRRPEDIVALEPLPEFHLLAIEADPRVRFERVKGRGEKVGESQMGWEQFISEEQAPTEVTIPQVIARASETINNDGTREQLEAKVHELIAKLGVKKNTAKV